MKRNLLFKASIWLLPLLLLPGMLGCGVVSSLMATPTPTATSAPTVTLTPTLAPTSTATPTTTPTPTPDYLATQSAMATEAVAARYEDAKRELERLKLPTGSGSLAWVQESPVEINMTGPVEMSYQSLAEGIVASDFVLQVDVTWETGGWPVCGILFRSDEDFERGEFYGLFFLRLSGLPAWDIEYWKRGDFYTNITQKVRFSDALKLGSGDTNRFLIYAQGNAFTVYINGIRQGRYLDFSNKLSSGRFGAAGTQDGGHTTCIYKNGWLWSY